ncbi:hypothetical protein CCR75_003502 [Bremia lactucae]|uniref:Uncharacterized protein n=1 Tax=Bremia lactucae TaxID=4779 RepID=A0A976IGP7_BRELC|nr:hypothetical protein CCR75_003502 [Bremia lactucae]
MQASRFTAELMTWQQMESIMKADARGRAAEAEASAFSSSISRYPAGQYAKISRCWFPRTNKRNAESHKIFASATAPEPSRFSASLNASDVRKSAHYSTSTREMLLAS